MGTILSFLTNSAVGALFGWVGGLVGRWMDMKEKAAERGHELLLLEKNREYMEKEAELALAREKELTAREVEVADSKGFAASFAADRAAYGGGRVDAFRGLTRPILTLYLVLVNTVFAGFVFWMVGKSQTGLTGVDWMKLALMFVDWVLTQGSICVGWWFGSRGKGK